MDKWCAIHNFDGDRKTAPIHLIFVVDGRIDACKISRNEKHEKRQSDLRKLRKIIETGKFLPDDLSKFRKLQRLSTRPNGQLVSDLVAWVAKKKHFTIFGSPWQADAQLVYLYRRFKWVQGVISEDSDIWTMGVKDWHSGYSTISKKKYRNVVGNNTKSRFLGDMSTDERIRFTMWTSNDYLPGIRGVGWQGAKRLHSDYEKILDADEKVIDMYDFILSH